jgi:hypothetical protein
LEGDVDDDEDADDDDDDAREIKNSCVFFCHSSTDSSGADAYPNPGKSIKYNLDCVCDIIGEDDFLDFVVVVVDDCDDEA